MYRGSTPRIVPIIVTIIIVALVIAALVALGRLIFNSGSGSSTTSSTTTLQDAVLNTAGNRSVRWTVRGPIVADENFQSYQITASPTERTYTVFTGYLDAVTSQKTYTNNERAYDEFVHALINAGITNTRSTPSDDLRGVCATGGIAYTFETLTDSQGDQLLWGSTCSQSKGTIAADALKIHALFTNQTPDFKPLFTSVY